MKVCSKCKVEKPSELVGKNGRCKACNNADRKARYWSNPEKYRAEDRKAFADNKDRRSAQKYASHVRCKYGLSPEWFPVTLQAQGHKCALCRLPVTEAVIDHDHKTGEVREILCVKCNNGLGQFNDSIETLQAAICYLEKHKKQNTK